MSSCLRSCAIWLQAAPIEMRVAIAKAQSIHVHAALLAGNEPVHDDLPDLQLGMHCAAARKVEKSVALLAVAGPAMRIDLPRA